MRSLGWTWLCLSPVLFIIAAISSVKSETTYYVQLAFFGMPAAAGIVGSVALLFGRSLGRRILQVLSWLGFAYFTGAALLVPVFHIVRSGSYTNQSWVRRTHRGINRRHWLTVSFHGS
jgi:ABC-type arginine/histidine transport system permease subunit